MKKLTSILFCLSLFSGSLLAQTNLIVNGDFETGDFSGWMVEEFGANFYDINDGSYEGDYCWDDEFGGSHPPISGSYSAVNDQEEEGYGLISGGFLAPANPKDVWLNFSIEYINDASFDFEEQDFQVYLLDDNMDQIELLFSLYEDDAPRSQSPARMVSLDITEIIEEYQGEMLYLQFKNIVENECFPLQLDDVSIIQQHQPIPTLSQWGIIALSMIMLILGLVFMKQRKVVFG